MKSLKNTHTWTRFFAIAVLCAMTAILIVPYPAKAERAATVVAGAADVYATAHIGSPVITQLPVGAAVRVSSYDSNWAEIILADGVTGYVVTAYLTFRDTSPAPTPHTPSVVATATVRTGPLNVHVTAALGSPVITQLATGTRVQLSHYDANWSEVILGAGQVGYVVTGYLNVGTQPAPSPTTPPSQHEKASTPGANATVATANKGPMHLRRAASFDAGLIATYANGSRVQVLSQKGGWYYVKAGTHTGYMDAEFVRLDTPQAIHSAIGYDAVVHNRTSGEILHLREKPSTNGKSLGEYHNGTYVEVLAAGLEWSHVIVDGKEGYMMTEFIEITSPNATASMLITGGEAGYVEMYDKAQTNSYMLMQLTNGVTVTLVTPDVEWSQVQYLYNGTMYTGYVKTQHLMKAE